MTLPGIISKLPAESSDMVFWIAKLPGQAGREYEAPGLAVVAQPAIGARRNRSLNVQRQAACRHRAQLRLQTQDVTQDARTHNVSGTECYLELKTIC